MSQKIYIKCGYLIESHQFTDTWKQTVVYFNNRRPDAARKLLHRLPNQETLVDFRTATPASGSSCAHPIALTD
ncbi:hypothetical protein KFK09_014277 [Dendrobium nobile]|uniref:Uncharacterized protein n=1 Tax=Dendrobium nobile TaxID=94219 RepID=A0A8T3B9F8_DENNO|nr:hypothetical protein KFK09_014277 [Dendrobium nobile]